MTKRKCETKDEDPYSQAFDSEFRCKIVHEKTQTFLDPPTHSVCVMPTLVVCAAKRSERVTQMTIQIDLNYI